MLPQEKSMSVDMSTRAKPQKPEAPANTSPAPTKPESRWNQGETVAPSTAPSTISEPAAICTWR